MNFVIILLGTLVGLSASLQHSNVGTRFLVAFPEGDYSTSHWSWENLEVHIAAESTATVHVTSYYFNRTVTVAAKSSTSVQLPKEEMHLGTELGHRSVYVVSDSEISLVASNIVYSEIGGSPDGMLIFPVEVLGTDYIVSSYTPFLMSEFVVANQDQTTYVSLKVKVTGGSLGLAYSGHTYKNGETLNVTLHPYETLQIQSVNKADLTGTLIHSSRPVAVFSGNRCVQVPKGFAFCDYAVDQLLPVNTWGTQFIVPPLYPRVGYVVRVIASTENTTVQFYNNSRQFNRRLNKGEFTDVLLGADALVVTGDKPISVLQFATSITYDTHGSGNGDPFLTVVPAIDHFSGSYFAPVPRDHAYHTYLAITVETSKKSGLRLNGQPINAIHSTSVSSPLNQYTVISTNLNSLTARVEHLQGSVKFGVVAFGNGRNRAYGFPLGMTLVIPAPHPNRGPICYSCQGYSDVSQCTTTITCAKTEVCVFEEYYYGPNEVEYLMECRSQATCNQADQSGERPRCKNCCSDDYCNKKCQGSTSGTGPAVG